MIQDIEMSNLEDPELIEEGQNEEVEHKTSSRALSKGTVMYILSVACSTLMHATSKLLLQESGTAEAVQMRMGFTAVVAIIILYVQKVEYNIIGPKAYRALLLLRGAFGLTNLSLVFYSLQYLTLPDVAVIGFLSPLCTLFAAGIFLGETVKWQQILCSFVGLFGVVVIARPPALFGGVEVDAQRTFAVCICLVSVATMGAVTILLRKLKNVTPMQSVGAYAAISAIATSVAIAAESIRTGTSVTHGYPHTPNAYLLLALATFFGFALQWLMSAALALEEASYLVNFSYTSLIWATLWEFVFWHDLPDMWTVIGTAIILSSVVYSATLKRS